MKRVFISRGNRGIGAALVKHFARLPDHIVAFTSHQGEAAATRLVEDLIAADRIRPFPMNLKDPAFVGSSVKQALE